jgi:NAD(P)-dependent dehydrogenase (short-subunit alcohol dehydrogenase family)
VLQKEGEAVAADISASQGQALFVKTDVTSEAAWNHLIATTIATYSTTRTPQDEHRRPPPLRRLGEVMDVAHGALHVASDKSSFVTSTELVIDGGYIAR